MITRQVITSVLSRDLTEVIDNTSDSLDLLEGKDILITGGAGFLGYEMVHLLANVGKTDGRKPIQLTIYDNFSRGRKLWLENLARQPNVNVVQHDITQPIPSDAPRFSYIVHAASIASPIFYRRHPIETIDANVTGLRHLLDYARVREIADPIEGMLFFSSSEIYGDPLPEAIPTSETYRGNVSCTGPRACYDESKRLGETLCVNFVQQFGCRVTIARPFNNYGPGLDINDRRLLPDLARDIFQGRDITQLSDGHATRTFCYISDALSGYLKILTHGTAGESYNIGVDTPEISVNNFIAKVVEIARREYSYSGKVVLRASADSHYLTDNPRRRCPDIHKARSELDYCPKVTLDDGLRRALAWYKENEL